MYFANIFTCENILCPIPLNNCNSSIDKNILILTNPVSKIKNRKNLRIIFDYCSNIVEEAILIGDILDSNDIINSSNSLKFIFNHQPNKINIIPGFNDPTSALLLQFELLSRFFTNFVSLDKQNISKINCLRNPSKTSVCGKDTIILSHHIISDMIKYIP